MLKEKLEEAIEKSNNDLSSFVWKGEKVKVNDKYVQEETRLVDFPQEGLQKCYDYCNTMLYNVDKDHPGRYPLLEIVKDQRERCNAELFLRWIEATTKSPRFTFMTSLRTFLDNNSQIKPSEMYAGDAVGQCPQEYVRVPINLVIDACLDKLGKLERKHITLKFILKQGLWFTQEESKDLTEKDENGNIKNKIDVVRERLGLNPSIKLFINPKGLSFSQFRAMINLRSRKYSELTSMQLETLRNRILFSLEDDIRYHIRQWEGFKERIEKVAEYKGYVIK